MIINKLTNQITAVMLVLRLGKHGAWDDLSVFTPLLLDSGGACSSHVSPAAADEVVDALRETAGRRWVEGTRGASAGGGQVWVSLFCVR